MSKSKKKPNVSATQIRNLLKGLAFNPNKPGPMSIVADMENVSFYELRAIEEIRVASNIRTNPIYYPGSSEAEYHQSITTAIRLLLLAQAHYGTTKT